MLKLRYLPIALFPAFLVLQCGGTQTETDAGTDAASQDGGKDGSVDSGKDAKADVVNDVITVDSPDDVVVDAPSDSAVDASADVAANDGGTISAISGLVLWLDAAKGVTTSNSAITAWADQSSQKNDATQGTSAPTLASSSINSLPAAHFVATSTQYVTIADAASLQFGTGDYYIAVVAKFDNDPTKGVTSGFGALYAKLGPSSGLLFFANDYDIASQTFAAGLCNLEGPATQVQYAAAYNDGAARLYAVQRASGTESLRVNGSQVASGSSAVDVSESGVAIDIGYMHSGPGAALDGDIAEIIAVKGTLASSDRTDIESYLQSKYGL